MFDRAPSFNQNICWWNPSPAANFVNFCASQAYCGECRWYTGKKSFETIAELRSAVETFCTNASAWVPGSTGYDEYG